MHENQCSQETNTTKKLKYNYTSLGNSLTSPCETGYNNVG